MRHTRRAAGLTGLRPLRLGELVRAGPDALVFAAHDTHGPLEVLVPPLLWEELRLDAPVMSNDEDARDYALGMVEASAAGLKPSIEAGHRRVRIE